MNAYGPNGLPYPLPIHPNLVHLTVGLVVIGIAFDIAGALYPIERRLFRFLALPVTRSALHDVGWYNLLAGVVTAFFTVAAGLYEMLLAEPLPGVTSAFGLGSLDTMLWHGVGGVALLLLLTAMAVWRGFQRFAWRRDMGRQVQWSYLLAGVGLVLLLAVHGTLGAQLAAEFGVHIAAGQLLQAGADLTTALP
ncbi:DUF2231 domain-containing protein [Vulcanococcus limneticus]|uniref:DUF2231 domain-containing protein n=1 Tax=Vulcanococcus limneticus TaxID=2170428 RepID=UPI00398BEEE7